MPVAFDFYLKPKATALIGGSSAADVVVEQMGFRGILSARMNRRTRDASLVSEAVNRALGMAPRPDGGAGPSAATALWTGTLHHWDLLVVLFVRREHTLYGSWSIESPNRPIYVVIVAYHI